MTSSKVIQQLIIDIIASQPQNLADFMRAKKKFSKNIKLAPPSNATLLSHYRQLVKQKKIKASPNLEKWLIKRPTRTLSGVSVITVLTKPWPCPGQCVYCPSEPDMPKSYLSNEPAAQRAVRNLFDPYRQVQARIQALENNGHQVDKIEILILGGTWSAYPARYQTWFVGRLFQAANNYNKTKRPYKGLAAEQKINETTRYRIIGLTMETRPDHIDRKEIKRLRELGCTRVQLGVQHTDDKILSYIQRGDSLANAIQATRLLKEAGLKVDHHYMPDLPGSTPAKDLAMFKYVYNSGQLSPDQIKIYPCVVNPHAQLYGWWKQGKYKPYSVKQLADLLIKVKLLTPPWIRINRLVRDIPKTSISAGNSITNLRQLLQDRLKTEGKECQCIRCREARGRKSNINKAKLNINKYSASQGKEYFISYTSPDKKIIYGFVRLRFNTPAANIVFSVLKKAALIRELHVYGQMQPVYDETMDDAVSRPHVQHRGLGRKLMNVAEDIARQHGYETMAVIAGIGVREYYRKIGYQLKDTYMLKTIKK
ncbi:MAG: elongator complex protein 3 [Candidatus Komeilibacteria bacterium]